MMRSETDAIQTDHYDLNTLLRAFRTVAHLHIAHEFLSRLTDCGAARRLPGALLLEPDNRAQRLQVRFGCASGECQALS